MVDFCREPADRCGCLQHLAFSQHECRDRFCSADLAHLGKCACATASAAGTEEGDLAERGAVAVKVATYRTRYRHVPDRCADDDEIVRRRIVDRRSDRDLTTAGGLVTATKVAKQAGALRAVGNLLEVAADGSCDRPRNPLRGAGSTVVDDKDSRAHDCLVMHRAFRSDQRARVAPGTSLRAGTSFSSAPCESRCRGRSSWRSSSGERRDPCSSGRAARGLGPALSFPASPGVRDRSAGHPS